MALVIIPSYFGLHRLIDVIVDKIVIAQQSLQAFINALSPGAYSSITKVNFKILDNSSLKPVGIYGSKEEIIRFLREINAVDNDTYVARSYIYQATNFIEKGRGACLRRRSVELRLF